MDLGISVIDRYTHYVLRFMESVNKTSQATMQDLVCDDDFYSFLDRIDTSFSSTSMTLSSLLLMRVSVRIYSTVQWTKP